MPKNVLNRKDKRHVNKLAFSAQPRLASLQLFLLKHTVKKILNFFILTIPNHLPNLKLLRTKIDDHIERNLE